MRALLPIALVLAGCAGGTGCAAWADGAAEGRRGNRLLAGGDTTGAIAAYREGLRATEHDGDPALRAALWNNLSLALYDRADYGEAAGAFDEAVALAADADGRGRFAYHAGTARARAGELEDAAHLRQALVARPASSEARFNYAWVKRRLDGPPPPDGTPPEPSAFARGIATRKDTIWVETTWRSRRAIFSSSANCTSTTVVTTANNSCLKNGSACHSGGT